MNNIITGDMVRPFLVDARHIDVAILYALGEEDRAQTIAKKLYQSQKTRRVKLADGMNEEERRRKLERIREAIQRERDA